MTKRVITISLSRVKLAGIMAFVRGELIAQHPHGHAMHNRYRNRGCPCVVGAALTGDEAKYLDQFTASKYVTPLYTVEELVGAGYVQADAVEAMQKLQRAHDDKDMDLLWSRLTEGWFYTAFAAVYKAYWKLRKRF
ncbi:hypothetical protein [Caulobacter phage BL198]|uniref:Uncharacterized protein n=1 Tax=Caulobacter phage BL198 TaxID=3020395 RepID=A0AAF0B9W1_9CAUD|nr:hypothetical protein [Caulobacter phage BL198]